MAYINVNNQQLYYEDHGDKNAPVLLFMHGFLMSSEMFASQVEFFSSYRVITFDARTFGKTKWDGEPFTLYDTVSDCMALLDHLGIEKVILAGMSQGGYAALRVALRFPSRVQGLILISTSAHVDADEVKAGYREVRDTWAEYGLVPQLQENLMTGIIGPKEGNECHWDKWTPSWQGRTANEIFHAMNNLIDRDDILPFLPEIKCPSLIIHGDQDFGVAFEMGEYLYNNLPNAVGFIKVEGGAHGTIMTHAETVNGDLLYHLENHLLPELEKQD
ncbi:alpha/beta fold hydrolase [Flammeovirga aprica]|uniref:Alpha/beta hydrolase n=1 Tax=Flammeovirga aprica JL-4 TaxID=694437 RepID=A0A7X9P0U3_9BACT|nr:alpha/beta hydrolase [Flammeovirga aprica]NME66937.1 alpha/beta hydrolase [Flammeovirga aprica JL-4]